MPASIHLNHEHPLLEDSDCDSRAITYVDDCHTITAADDASTVKIYIQATNDNAERYLTSNRLKPNLSKNQLLVLALPKIDKSEISILAQGVIIKPKPVIKTLGVLLSEKRDWTPQVNSLISSVQPRLSVLRNLACIASTKSLAILAQATIVSKITYVIAVWGGTSICNKQKIQKVINQAARICLGPKSYNLSQVKMLESLNWDSVDQIIDRTTLSLALKTMITEKPAALLPRLSRFRARLTRNSENISRFPPKWKQMHSRWSFSYRSVLLLNNCPDVILKEAKLKVRNKAVRKLIRLTTPIYTSKTGSIRKSYTDVRS